MNKRRSLTPHTGTPAGTHAMRRGGARQQVSDRVTFKRDGETRYQGWALNVSKGGLRAILDAEDAGKNVELGEEYEVVLGDPDAEGNAGKRARIVWLQEEPDGFVVGVEYIGLSGMHAAAEPVPAPVDDDASGEKPKNE